MTTKEMQAALLPVSFRGWSFTVRQKTYQPPYLQVSFTAYDRKTHRTVTHHGRKWQLSTHMTKSELISTALKAVLTAVEHEAREDFTYRGVAIYGPHLNVDALVILGHSTGATDKREPPPSG